MQGKIRERDQQIEQSQKLVLRLREEFSAETRSLQAALSKEKHSKEDADQKYGNKISDMEAAQHKKKKDNNSLLEQVFCLLAHVN